MKIQTQKLEKIRFSINPQEQDLPVSLTWRDGELYISLRGMLIKEGDRWYEVPVKELLGIEVLEDGPFGPQKIAFNMALTKVIVTGKNASFLAALRHFLMPYISERRTGLVMGSFLKLWALGLREPEAIGEVLGVGEEVVEALINDALKKGLINEKGKLNAKAKRYISKEDWEFLKEMEVLDD